jgi:UDP:flavonoid glycosyltransferase YjiC (YdhE family)
MTTPRARTFLFAPGSGFGPVNNSTGIAALLMQRGHKVVFLVERSWEGRLRRLGFGEELVDKSPPSTVRPERGPAPQSGQSWADFEKQRVPLFRQSAFQQLESFMAPSWRGVAAGVRHADDATRAVVQRTRPDVVIVDNAVTIPALTSAGVPHVRIVTSNPLEIRGASVPPTYSGLPMADSSDWEDFRAEFDRTHRPVWEPFNEWVVGRGGDALPDLELIGESPHLNFYLYPAAMDYVEDRPLGASWVRLDSCVRRTESQPFALPERLATRPGSWVYLSLGSLASADVELMRRLISALAPTRHKYLVSMGPRHAELELADNMVGAHQLPQVQVLPLVDLVITHGGNNTVTEALHFGKPLVVLPLFWDQHDNAQRVHETGHGRRVPYDFSADEIVRAVDETLEDEQVRHRAAETGEQVRARSGLETAAQRLADLAG